MRRGKRFWSAQALARGNLLSLAAISRTRSNFSCPFEKGLCAHGVVLPIAFTGGPGSGLSHFLAKRTVRKQVTYQASQFFSVAGILQRRADIGVRGGVELHDVAGRFVKPHRFAEFCVADYGVVGRRCISANNEELAGQTPEQDQAGEERIETFFFPI